MTDFKTITDNDLALVKGGDTFSSVLWTAGQFATTCIAAGPWAVAGCALVGGVASYYINSELQKGYNIYKKKP